MRFLHTADWHLGRLFHNVSLLGDQAHVLEQVIALAREAAVDAVVVAGDVYDRAVPPADAVRLLDETVGALVMGAGIPVLMIAGNHDGAERLAFASGLLGGQGFHVRGPLAGAGDPITLTDAHGPVHFCLLPYADPSEVRLHLGREDLRTHDDALRALAGAACERVTAGERAVAVAHCWVSGAATSESERPLTVGGAGEVGADVFDGFCHAALGHLHRPQSPAPAVTYSGSLLKYSFSEAAHRKSVSIVEIDAAGASAVERVELSPRRDVRILEGALRDLLKGPGSGESRDDYLLVRLTDTHAILDAMGKLREAWPNVLHLERPGLEIGTEADREARDHRRRTELELFRAFHEEVTGTAPEATAEAALTDVVEALRRAEREVGS